MKTAILLAISILNGGIFLYASKTNTSNITFSQRVLYTDTIPKVKHHNNSIKVQNRQNQESISDKKSDTTLFSAADDEPRFVQRNLDREVPTRNGAPAGQYTVIVQFRVDTVGNISDVKALSNHGYGMEEEAIRVIKKRPKWAPAIQSGRPIIPYRKVPITFIVEEQKSKQSKL